MNAPGPRATPLLSVEDLSVAFGPRQVVRGVSFAVHPGETVALVGESGSGKSVTALSALRLLPPAGHNPTGRVTLDGTDVLGADERTLQHLRGGVAGIVFQEPMTSLNPLHSIARQVGEAVTLPLRMNGRKVSVATIAFGRMCRAISRVSETPSARAART